MGDKHPPSIEELSGFANEIRGASPDDLIVDIHESGLNTWKANIDAIIQTLRQAEREVHANHVYVGEVSELYSSAKHTADNLNDSGKAVKDNIYAGLEVAIALQEIIQSAFDRIKIQSGG